MKTLKKSLVVEAALAGLFAAAAVLPAVAADMPQGGDQPAPAKKAPAKKGAGKVHCFGVNACKGKSECAVQDKSQCKGQNACKGQGWVSLTAKKCTAKKGTVMPEKKADMPAAPAPAAAPASK